MQHVEKHDSNTGYAITFCDHHLFFFLDSNDLVHEVVNNSFQPFSVYFAFAFLLTVPRVILRPSGQILQFRQVSHWGPTGRQVC